MENVIIVGTGCAGLTGAIYAARANLSPLVLEGRQPGGQLTTTTAVENYPGFPDGVDGPDLILRMHQQAEKFGARFEYGTVEDFEHVGTHSRIKVDGHWRDTKALIVASGASPRYLGLDRERELIGHGLTSCATCDGAFYRNVPVCVVGGGDSACEEAIFLTRFASRVYLIHRRKELRASKIMADRMLANPKIEPIWDTVITEYLNDDAGEMRAVRLKNVKTDASSELDVKCVFIAIGHVPNTAPFQDKLDMDENGYLVQQNGTHTNLAGVFAAGDVADHVYRQAITAAGEGCAAAMDAERWLSEQE
jgi:thioredoxin reductase (NADPH)